MSAAQEFWSTYQPGFRYSEHAPGTPRFFREVEEHRYRTEPAIPELVRFPEWRGSDVLEIGCGIGTDGVNFARHGARYTGLDQSPTAVAIANRRFADEGLDGQILHGTAVDIPLPDASVDLVYSNGVLHHIEETDRAVAEAARVLRSGGRALVMLYHRDSLNYRFTIMVVRRALAAALLLPGGALLPGRFSPDSPEILAGHRALLRKHGIRYLSDRQLFLSNNTDGPGNPLSKAYSRGEAAAMFRRAGFRIVRTTTRFLNLRLYPRGEQLSQTRLAQRLERRYGWHLWVDATL